MFPGKMSGCLGFALKQKQNQKQKKTVSSKGRGEIKAVYLKQGILAIFEAGLIMLSLLLWMNFFHNTKKNVCRQTLLF